MLYQHKVICFIIVKVHITRSAWLFHVNKPIKEQLSFIKAHKDNSKNGLIHSINPYYCFDEIVTMCYSRLATFLHTFSSHNTIYIFHF